MAVFAADTQLNLDDLQDDAQRDGILQEGLLELDEHQKAIKELEGLVKDIFDKVSLNEDLWTQIKRIYQKRCELLEETMKQRSRMKEAHERLVSVRAKNTSLLKKHFEKNAFESSKRAMAIVTDVRVGTKAIPVELIEKAMYVLRLANVPWDQVSDTVRRELQSVEERRLGQELDDIKSKLEEERQKTVKFKEDRKLETDTRVREFEEELRAKTEGEEAMRKRRDKAVSDLEVEQKTSGRNEREMDQKLREKVRQIGDLEQDIENMNRKIFQDNEEWTFKLQRLEEEKVLLTQQKDEDISSMETRAEKAEKKVISLQIEVGNLQAMVVKLEEENDTVRSDFHTFSTMTEIDTGILVDCRDTWADGAAEFYDELVPLRKAKKEADEALLVSEQDKELKLKEAEQLLQNTKEEAERLVESRKAEAEQLLQRHKKEAEDLLQTQKEEAERLLQNQKQEAEQLREKQKQEVDLALENTKKESERLALCQLVLADTTTHVLP